MSELSPPGTYQIISAELQSLATGNRTIEFPSTFGYIEINESVFQTFIYGTIPIVDSTNMHKSLPITGSELLYLRLKDWNGDETFEMFFVFGMSNFKYASPNDSSVVEYTLHFCSREKFISDTADVKRAFHGPIHNQVESIYQDYYKNYDEDNLKYLPVPFKSIYAQETGNSSTYVIPNLKPDEAISFLARRAYSTQDNYQTYLFYETRDKYYFQTPQNAYLQSNAETGTQPIKYVYNLVYDATDPSSAGLDSRMRQIVNVNINSKFNTMDSYKKGGYISKTTELDILNRSVKTTTFDFARDLQENSFYHGDVYLRHSAGFVNTYFQNAPNYLVVQDYLTPGMDPRENAASAILTRRDTQYYGELTTTNSAFYQNLAESSITITVRGARNIRAGRYIELEFPSMRNSPEQLVDPYYSGKYMILTCKHRYEGNEYFCDLLVSRGGLPVDPALYAGSIPATPPSDGQSVDTTGQPGGTEPESGS